MRTAQKSFRTRSNGRQKSAAVVQTTPAAHVRRQEQRTIHFLTQDELRRLFKVIRSKRDKAIFLVAYRHGLRASEIGLLQRADVDVKQGRISIHRLKGSILRIDTLCLEGIYRQKVMRFSQLVLGPKNIPHAEQTVVSFGLNLPSERIKEG